MVPLCLGAIAISSRTVTVESTNCLMKIGQNQHYAQTTGFRHRERDLDVADAEERFSVGAVIANTQYN